MRGQEQTETFSVAVPSASIEDKQWIVTFVGSCQCPAFSWRRKCRHVTEAMDALEALVNVGHELAEEDKP